MIYQSCAAALFWGVKQKASLRFFAANRLTISNSLPRSRIELTRALLKQNTPLLKADTFKTEETVNRIQKARLRISFNLRPKRKRKKRTKNNMSSSKSVLMAMGKVVFSELSFVCMIESTKNYFIALSRHSFFLLTPEKLSYVAEVFYAHIEKVVLDTSTTTLVQIFLSDNREKNLPSTLSLCTDDRRLLVDNLKVMWKTDCMFRLNMVPILPIFKAKIKMPENLANIKSEHPVLATMPRPDHGVQEMRGCRFFIEPKRRRRSVLLTRREN
jgi:5-bromo-4-chloroindolyl phosphate hydrolysis protein